MRTDMAFGFQRMAGTIHTVIASEAKQSNPASQKEGWIASSLSLLAMTKDESQDGPLSRKYGSTGPWTLIVSGLP